MRNLSRDESLGASGTRGKMSSKCCWSWTRPLKSGGLHLQNQSREISIFQRQGFFWTFAPHLELKHFKRKKNTFHQELRSRYHNCHESFTLLEPCIRSFGFDSEGLHRSWISNLGTGVMERQGCVFHSGKGGVSGKEETYRGGLANH